MIDFMVFWCELFALGFLVLCLFATAVVLYFSLLAWLEDRGVEHAAWSMAGCAGNGWLRVRHSVPGASRAAAAHARPVHEHEPALYRRKKRLEACARTARAHANACAAAGMPRAAAVAHQAADDHLLAAERCGRRREGRAA